MAKHIHIHVHQRTKDESLFGYSGLRDIGKRAALNGDSENQLLNECKKYGFRPDQVQVVIKAYREQKAKG